MISRLRQNCCGWAAAALLLASGRAGAASLDVPLLITQVPRSAWAADRVGASDSLLSVAPFGQARIIRLSPEGEVQVLSEGFESACDPDVSFDGGRLLFAGKKTGDARWRIWEAALDDSGTIRAVSPEGLDARMPIHVSTLFTLDSPEPWFTFVFVGWETAWNETGGATTASLFNLKLDGTELRRLTCSPTHSADPFQMWDGRVLYATEVHSQEPRANPSRVGIHAIHVEGADMERYVGDGGQRVRRMPCATENGLVVFVERDAAAGGGLGCVSQRRPSATYRRLTTPETHEFLHPTPLAGSTLLVARRRIVSEETFGIVTFDTDSARSETVFDTPQFHEVQAKPLRPRPRPDGHSTVVNPQAATGVFYGLNAYTANPDREAHLQAGEIKRVRLIEGVAGAIPPGQEVPARWPIILRRLIGEAPVEADGSFNVEVPADTPILLQTLDARGLALGTCGWIWVKPKETRGCIGCHEDPELIPENEYVLALRRPSNRLVIPPHQRRAPSFAADIAPVLQRHCAAAECHGGQDTPLHLPLSADTPSEDDLIRAYEALTVPEEEPSPRSARPPLPGRYLDAGRARTSWLIWQLTGTRTARPWDLTEGTTPASKIQHMPPPGRGTPLSAEDLRTVIQWIDIGAQYEAAKTSQPERPQLAEGR